MKILKITLIVCLFILFNLSAFALEINRHQEKMNKILLRMDNITFFKKLFGNFYRQFSSNLNDFIANNNSLAPEVSLLSETDIRSDKDCFQREDFEISIFEETIFGSNFSSMVHNCTSNSTVLHSDLAHAPQFDNSSLTKGLILSVIALFSFVGNISTLASIKRTRQRGSSTVYMLLAQLAIADLLVTLFCILAEGMWTLSVAWYGGNLLCKIVKFMQMFALYLSTFVLVLIGFDRLSAIRSPMHRAHAKQHVRRGIACIWILSGIFSSPQLFIFSVMRGPFIEEFFQCVTYAFYTAQWQEQLYTTLTLVFMFLLPLLILITTYTATFITIANRENVFSERIPNAQFQDARHKILHRAKVKSLMITVVIVLTFVICWTPYYIMMIIFMFMDPDEQLSQDLQSAIFFFGSSTAMLNPLIYGAFHLRTKKKTRSKSTSFNYSISSKMDHTFTTTFRRNNPRKSNDESIGLQKNGTLTVPCTSRGRKSDLSNLLGVDSKLHVSSF